MRTDEQVLHDRINLPRLVKRLEQFIQHDDWSNKSPPGRETWFKAQATLQQIRYARLLLKNVELDHVDPTPADERRYHHFKTTLKHLEDYMLQVEQHLTHPLQAWRPKPLLPSIRPPPRTPTSPSTARILSPVEATLIPAEPAPSTPFLDALLPEPEPGPVSHLPGPTLAPPSTATITATPTLLQNSRARQEELAEQLALMATQLHRNATHFSDALDKDKSILESMQEKVEGNLTFMQRERIRLRDFRGKSGSTTCLVMTSVVVVLIAFLIMVFIIRLT